jgi:hypothetical protein
MKKRNYQNKIYCVFSEFCDKLTAAFLGADTILKKSKPIYRISHALVNNNRSHKN